MVQFHIRRHLLAHYTSLDQTPHHLEEGHAHPDEKPTGSGSMEEKVPHVEHEEVPGSQTQPKDLE